LKQMVKLAALTSFEKIINKLLAYDPLTRDQLANIQDAIICIEVENPDFVFWVHFTEQQIRLISEWHDPVDATIRGSLSSFLALAKEQDKNQVLMRTRMEVAGNTQLLTQVQQLAAQLDIDWEAAIADITGDVPGHLLASAIKQGFGFANEIKRSLDHSWGNYWQHETDTLLHANEYQQTATNISQLRFEADRLEARINRLIRHSEAQS